MTAANNICLNLQSMKYFPPEQVSRQICHLKAMLSMRNLLRDLKANSLDNQAFHKEIRKNSARSGVKCRTQN